MQNPKVSYLPTSNNDQIQAQMISQSPQTIDKDVPQWKLNRMLVKQDPQYKSFYSSFYIEKDGVISLSLKDMTILCNMIITCALLGMLYESCKAGTFVCEYGRFPYISEIIKQTMYVRIYIFLTAVYMFGVHQLNIRAFHKKLHGVITRFHNDIIMHVGFASTLALPLIGLFDMDLWPASHGMISLIFFLTFGGYCIMLSQALSSNIDKFPESDQRGIKIIRWASYGLFFTILAFFVAFKYVPLGPTAYIEWFMTLYFINIFTITSFTNQFYDSVHDPSTD
ncbi:UNKNOWN [Stylonychia lemnae]|uniref:Uncharacterized protein n=1 Tax=Stylonychia lemnae TaxID=5949 RepID=A0A078A792_STYLE|nr:UNKNOWN [Stylonychia lemnae]|eukprot:CDW77397.1 UNKNOWN [Stylonychia lemnae]